MDAIIEYKETETFKVFNNYQKYYEDANQQNKALNEVRKPLASSNNLERRISSLQHKGTLQTQHSGQSFNLNAFLGEDAPHQRDRFAAVSFKDGGRFVMQESSKWQQEVHDLLMRHDSINEEVKNETNDSFANLDLHLERQVSNQDNNPLIDQSQPFEDKFGPIIVEEDLDNEVSQLECLPKLKMDFQTL